MGLALVGSRLREQHDGHQLGRGVRRRVPQGRAGHRRADDVRRSAEECGSGAAERERRPQGRRPRALPRLHPDLDPRERVLVARGLRQRLRDRQPVEEALRQHRLRATRVTRSTSRTTTTSSAGLRTTSASSTPRSASSRAARRAAHGGSPPRTSTRRSGASSSPSPTGGTSPSTPRRTATDWPTSSAGRSALGDKLDEFFATPETAELPGSYGRPIHEMLEARDVRQGQWGLSNQLSHHIPYMYNYAGEPSKGAAVIREALSPQLHRQRHRTGLPGRRGQRRALGVAGVQLTRHLPAADGLPDLRHRLPTVHQGDAAPRERQGPRDQRAEEQRVQRLRPGRTRQRGCAVEELVVPRPAHRWREHRVRHGRDAVGVGHWSETTRRPPSRRAPGSRPHSRT